MSTNFDKNEDNSMKKTIRLFVRKAIDDQSGQILPWLAVVLVGMLGMAGLTVDVGRAYVAHVQLQNYANAAALAAAGEVYNTSSTNGAVPIANCYSGSACSQTVNPSLGTVTTTVTTVCMNILEPAGSTCSKSSVANAVKVAQTASVPTTFMKLFGFNSLSVSSSATASMQGAAQPWNVAVILDATVSMGSTPVAGGSCAGYSTLFKCAQGGVQALLQAVQPCPGGTGCTSTNTQFRVALFTFPNMSTSNVSNFWVSCSQPTSEHYTMPLTNLTAYTPLTYSGATATYEATPVNTSDGDKYGFVSDYWSATQTNNLNTSSSIVKEVTGCLSNPGGQSSYFAGAIYAAQAALKAEQAKYGGQNAIIILSDGQMQADSSKFPSGNVSPSASGYNASAMTTTGYYPSAKDDCQQGIMAAQTAQTAGTTVFSVAFGSESGGCTSSGGGTDTSLIATATTGNTSFSTVNSITPCTTMKNIASPTVNGVSYFYADTTSSKNGCTDTAHTVSEVNQIFWAISSYFTSPRLVSNNAAYTVISN